jgi:hypothetical protein
MSDPLPKEWFGEAWNARVGYWGVRWAMYRAWRMRWWVSLNHDKEVLTSERRFKRKEREKNIRPKTK